MTGIFYEHIIEGAQQQGISLPAALSKVRSMGYEALECDLWRLSDSKQTKALFDDCGFNTVSVYSTYDFPHECASRAREKYLSHLETAAFFGARKVLCVPGFINLNSGDNAAECMRRTAERLGEMCAAAESFGITVTVEDYDDINSPCCKTADIKYLLDNVPRLMFTLDTGNFAYCLESAYDAAEMLFGRIAHVHLKDRLRGREGTQMQGGKADMSGEYMYPCPVGGGYIGIGKIIGTLAEKGYKGDYSAEHFGAPNQFEYMEKSIDFLSEFLNIQGGNIYG